MRINQPRCMEVRSLLAFSSTTFNDSNNNNKCRPARFCFYNLSSITQPQTYCVYLISNERGRGVRGNVCVCVVCNMRVMGNSMENWGARGFHRFFGAKVIFYFAFAACDKWTTRFERVTHAEAKSILPQSSGVSII